MNENHERPGANPGGLCAIPGVILRSVEDLSGCIDAADPRIGKTQVAIATDGPRTHGTGSRQ